MGKRLKELCEWVEGVGYHAHSWIGGDWHVPMHLLSKLMAAELENRRQVADIDAESDVTLKVSFDSMLQLAEETFGIPILVTERDLLLRYPNINLALVTYLVCVKATIDHFDAKQIRATKAPRLLFEAKNGSDVTLPSCPSCSEHVFIIERVVVENSVWHRQCFKCCECGRLLSRGAFKRSKCGFECIHHAVRRILDAHESNSGSGSGTYDRYGGRSPRPVVAPPPRPKPLPPPKPAYLSTTRPDPVYETLDDAIAGTSKAQETYEELEGTEAKVQRSSSLDEGTADHYAEDEKQEESKPLKEEEKEEGEHSPPASSDDSHSSGDSSSIDSGVVLRMARMFSGEDPVRTRGSSVPGVRASQPPVVTTPVAPPRPKRTSMLLSSGTKTLPGQISPSSTVSSRSSTLSRQTPIALSSPKPRLELDDYPNYLCPFGEEDEDNEEPSDYPESKNPFADSDDDTPKVPVPAPRTLPPPVPGLPGTSDRPKVQPPPPPPGAQVEVIATPPPKPPRGNVASADSRIQTLKISRKKTRAPLPPVPQMRKINFTDNGVKEDPELIKSRLSAIEEQILRVEVEGRAVEKEFLFQIATNPTSWAKNHRTDDWISILSKKLELMREQLCLLGMWRETYLNEVHSETEYYIRCLLEKEKSDKSEWEIEREATLTNLLIYIIDEKLKLDEYMADLRMAADSTPGDEVAKAKKTKLRKRVKMLTKKLKSSKKN